MRKLIAILALLPSIAFSAIGDIATVPLNAATASAFRTNPADCSAGQFAHTIAANGDLTCSAVPLTSGVSGTLPVTSGGTGITTGTSAYALIGTGTTATGAFQPLAVGATTEILVGGGASALPVWTTAQGSGAPVRATSPTLTTPTTSGIVTVGPTDASNAATVKLLEGSSGGTEFIGLKAPNAITTSVTYTLPVEGNAGQVLSTNGSGVLSWAENAASGMGNPMTTTGDIVYASDTAAPATAARLGIGSAGQCLVVDSGLPAWGSCAGGVGVAGSDTHIQYNNAGAFGASSNFIWNNTNKTLSVTGTNTGAKVSFAVLNDSTGNAATNEIRIGNSGGADALALSVNSAEFTAAGNYAYIYNRLNAPLILGTNNTARVTIAADGGVTSTGALSIAATSNQIILQSAGVTGTITATPTSSGKTWTLPDATGTVALTNVAGGGTGAATFTAGGVLFGNTTSALAASAAGTTGQFLISGGAGSPTWTTATLAGANFANQGTTTTVLHGNASGNPSWGAINLAGDVSGTLPVANGGSGRTTGTTAYALLATGTTATGAQQTLAAGATTEILVGGGASALPVWTTVTGTGAPVRATTPTLVTPVLGVATGTSLHMGSVTWLQDLIPSRFNPISDYALYSYSATSPRGSGLFAIKSSDIADGNPDAMYTNLAAVAINDKTGPVGNYGTTVYGIYVEAHKTADAKPLANAHGMEIAVVNKYSSSAVVEPYNPNPRNLTEALRLMADDPDEVGTSNLSVALTIGGRDPQFWNTGINISNVGVHAGYDAIAMASGQLVSWHRANTPVTAAAFRSVSLTDDKKGLSVITESQTEMPGQAGSVPGLNVGFNYNGDQAINFWNMYPSSVSFSFKQKKTATTYGSASTDGVDLLFISSDGNVTIPQIKSTTGTRYVCVNTDGTLVSSTTACSGT